MLCGSKSLTDLFTLHSCVLLLIPSLAGHFLWPTGNVEIGVNEWVLGTPIMEPKSSGKSDKNKAKKRTK